MAVSSDVVDSDLKIRIPAIYHILQVILVIRITGTIAEENDRHYTNTRDIFLSIHCTALRN